MHRSLLLSAALASLASRVDAQATPPRWTLAADLRIGSETAGPEYQFGQAIRTIALGPAGSIYVVIEEDQAIRQYDSTGTYVRTMGRRGQGPGEFSLIGAIGLLGDTLYAIDIQRVRTTLFSLSGAVLSTIPWEQTILDTGVTRMRTSVSTLLSDGTGLGSASSAAPHDRAPLLRVTRSARLIDTIAWVSLTNAAGYIQTSVGRVGGGFGQPFGDQPLVDWNPDLGRIAITERRAATSAAPSIFRVITLDLEGDTLSVRTYPYVPKPLPRARVDSAFAPLRARLGEARIKEVAYIPAYLPPLSGSFLTRDGTMWLARETGEESVDWVVIGPSGAIMATVAVPRNVTVAQVSGDTIWAVETNSLDVPQLVRFRVIRR